MRTGRAVEYCSIATSPPSEATSIFEIVRGGLHASFTRCASTCSKNECPNTSSRSARRKWSAHENRPLVRSGTVCAWPRTGMFKSAETCSTTSGRHPVGSSAHDADRTGKVTARSTEDTWDSSFRIWSYTGTDLGHTRSGFDSVVAAASALHVASALTWYPISRVTGEPPPL